MSSLPEIPRNTVVEFTAINLPAAVRHQCDGKDSCKVIYHRDDQGRATLNARTDRGLVSLDPKKLVGKGVGVDRTTIKIVP